MHNKTVIQPQIRSLSLLVHLDVTQKTREDYMSQDASRSKAHSKSTNQCLFLCTCFFGKVWNINKLHWSIAHKRNLVINTNAIFLKSREENLFLFTFLLMERGIVCVDNRFLYSYTTDLLQVLCSVIPQACNPNVSHFSRVSHQVQAFIYFSIDDGECTVLWNLLINTTGAEGFCVTACSYLESENKKPWDTIKTNGLLCSLCLRVVNMFITLARQIIQPEWGTLTSRIEARQIRALSDSFLEGSQHRAWRPASRR